MPDPDDAPDDADGEGKKARRAKKAPAQEDANAPVKTAVEKTKKAMADRRRLFGELMAMLADERRDPVLDTNGQPKHTRQATP